MELAEDLYKEELLEHNNNPQNYGKIKNPTSEYKDFNPVCGDEIHVYLKINKDIVTDIKFTGKGCAISQAAASIITEELKGKPSKEIENYDNEKMRDLLPVKIVNLRIKCALLALKAIKKAIVAQKVK